MLWPCANTRCESDLRLQPSPVGYSSAGHFIGADADASSDWTDKSPHKTEFVRVNGVRLHYLDWGGKRETILFLHGLGDTPHIFDDLAPKFTNQFRVLGLTRRGHGQSEAPETGYDTATRVEDIRQFLDTLNIPRAVLVGHSAAGGEMTLLAGVHPDRVFKLIYLDATYDSAAWLEMGKQMPPDMNPSKTDVESLDSLRRWTKRMNNGWSQAWEATLRELFSSDGKTFLNQAKRSRAIGSMLQAGAEARQDYTKIRSPALNIKVVGFPSSMVNGFKALPDARRKQAEDFIRRFEQLQQQEIERFRKEIPSGRTVVLTNADHHCFIERENEVVREMRAFLAR